MPGNPEADPACACARDGPGLGDGSRQSRGCCSRNPSQRGFSLWLGLGLLLIGAAVAVVSAVQFHTVVRGLGEKEIPRGDWTRLGV